MTKQYRVTVNGVSYDVVVESASFNKNGLLVDVDD